MEVFLAVGFGADDHLLYTYVFNSEDEARAFVTALLAFVRAMDAGEYAANYHKEWIKL